VVQRLDLEQTDLAGSVAPLLDVLLLIASGAEGPVAGSGEDRRLKAWISSSTVRPRKALRRSGRSMVMIAFVSSVSYRMSW
jgi:hypothetical protein